MTTHHIAATLTPQAVSKGLKDFSSDEHWIGSPAWAQFLKMYKSGGGLGEVRSPEDWNGLPKERYLKVVYLVDDQGPVLRWVDPEDERVVASMGGELPRKPLASKPDLQEPPPSGKGRRTHLLAEHILRGDYKCGDLRKGHIKVHSNGQLTVEDWT